MKLYRVYSIPHPNRASILFKDDLYIGKKREATKLFKELSKHYNINNDVHVIVQIEEIYFPFISQSRIDVLKSLIKGP